MAAENQRLRQGGSDCEGRADGHTRKEVCVHTNAIRTTGKSFTRCAKGNTLPTRRDALGAIGVLEVQSDQRLALGL